MGSGCSASERAAANRQQRIDLALPPGRHDRNDIHDERRNNSTPEYPHLPPAQSHESQRQHHGNQPSENAAGRTASLHSPPTNKGVVLLKGQKREEHVGPDDDGGPATAAAAAATRGQAAAAGNETAEDNGGKMIQNNTPRHHAASNSAISPRNGTGSSDEAVRQNHQQPHAPTAPAQQSFVPHRVFICRFCGGKKCKHENWRLQKRTAAIRGLHSDWLSTNIIGMQRPSSRLLREFSVCSQFAELNVTAVFNLQKPGEHPLCGDGILPTSGFSYDPQEFTSHGIAFYNFGFVDMGVPSMSTVMDIMHTMAYHITEARESVAVHCHAGYGRTGVIIACWFVYAYGLPADTAVEKARARRPGSVQTSKQVSFVQAFHRFLLRLRRQFAVRTTGAMVPHEQVFDAECFTLADCMERQGTYLHGEQRDTFKQTPRVIFWLCSQLVRFCDPWDHVYSGCSDFSGAATVDDRKMTNRGDDVCGDGDKKDLDLGNEVARAFIQPSDEWTDMDDVAIKKFKCRINQDEWEDAQSGSLKYLAQMIVDWFDVLAEPVLGNASAYVSALSGKKSKLQEYATAAPVIAADDATKVSLESGATAGQPFQDRLLPGVPTDMAVALVAFERDLLSMSPEHLCTLHLVVQLLQRVLSPEIQRGLRDHKGEEKKCALDEGSSSSTLAVRICARFAFALWHPVVPFRGRDLPFRTQYTQLVESTGKKTWQQAADDEEEALCATAQRSASAGVAEATAHEGPGSQQVGSHGPYGKRGSENAGGGGGSSSRRGSFSVRVGLLRVRSFNPKLAIGPRIISYVRSLSRTLPERDNDRSSPRNGTVVSNVGHAGESIPGSLLALGLFLEQIVRHWYVFSAVMRSSNRGVLLTLPGNNTAATGNLSFNGERGLGATSDRKNVHHAASIEVKSINSPRASPSARRASASLIGRVLSQGHLQVPGSPAVDTHQQARGTASANVAQSSQQQLHTPRPPRVRVKSIIITRSEANAAGRKGLIPPGPRPDVPKANVAKLEKWEGQAKAYVRHIVADLSKDARDDLITSILREVRAAEGGV